MAPAGATHSLTVPPRFCCKSSSRSGLVGSAVATVTVELSMAIGQARFWRKYLGDSVLTRGSEDAISSADMKGRPCWIASARSTSSDAARFTEGFCLHGAIILLVGASQFPDPPRLALLSASTPGR